MKAQELKLVLSEMDKTLMRRHKLFPLLEDKNFLEYIAGLIELFQNRYETDVSLTTAIELISAAIKHEPKVHSVLFLEKDIAVQEHILDTLSLAIIQQLMTKGYLSTTEKAKPIEPKTRLDQNVFVIHGKDLKLAREVAHLLKDLNLNPIFLHEQPSGSRTIVEKLEKYSDVGYAIVLLSADEVMPTLPSPTLIRRAKQNVILEFGYFMGLLGRDRIICLAQESVELPSDMSGIVYIPFKESVNEVRNKIVKELKAAGYRLEPRSKEGVKSAN